MSNKKQNLYYKCAKYITYTIGKSILICLIKIFIYTLFFSLCTLIGFLLSYLIEWQIPFYERITFDYLVLCFSNVFIIIFIIGLIWVFCFDKSEE